jgi:NAD(P)-dependent dehydrogenase (short-subunit alcohol dehydrogenase family)
MAFADELFDLTDQVVLITGGSRGLGREMAMAAARCGADVVIASRSMDSCTATASEIEDETGRAALPYQVHVGRWEQLDDLVVAAAGLGVHRVPAALARRRARRDHRAGRHHADAAWAAEIAPDSDGAGPRHSGAIRTAHRRAAEYVCAAASFGGHLKVALLTLADSSFNEHRRLPVVGRADGPSPRPWSFTDDSPDGSL